MRVQVIEDKQTQIDGIDIVAHCSLRLQVKCDFGGGDRKFGGTGNLFIQTSELNPKQAH